MSAKIHFYFHFQFHCCSNSSSSSSRKSITIHKQWCKGITYQRYHPPVPTHHHRSPNPAYNVSYTAQILNVSQPLYIPSFIYILICEALVPISYHIMSSVPNPRTQVEKGNKKAKKQEQALTDHPHKPQPGV